MQALVELTPWHWVGFIVCVLVFLALDLGLFHRQAHVVKFREAFGWAAVWFVVAMLFAGGLALWRDKHEAVEFTTGYFIELSLSLDNVFVIALIFSHFQVRAEFQHRVLFWGILGALLMRGFMIGVGVALINQFEWILYALGLLLLFAGIKMLLVKEEGDPEKSWVLRVARSMLPVSREFEGQKFITRINGRRLLTPLFLVLLMVETTDLFFAVDSIPAVFGVTRKPFIVFTSNVFAILGLRSMYFVLAGAIKYFRYLKLGLSIILVLIGVKMLIDPHDHPPRWFQYDVPDGASLVVVMGIIAVSILASLVAAWRGEFRRRKTLGFAVMKFRWSVAPAQPLLTGPLANGLKISPLLVQCLLNRGLSEPAAIETFLEPRLKQLADPFRLPHMAAVVDRLFQARERGEPLVIFGDYDVDGVTSTALLTETMRALGWTVNYYLPNRMDEGYGLSQDGVENCVAKFPVTLLLAVDCGSTAVASIAWLRQKGVDVLVLDHHQISTPAPAALALVNPQLSSGEFQELCTAGLAFKLAHALVKRGRELGLAAAQDYDVRPLLDLVALGTIADLVPLTGESRILAAMGLERLSVTSRPGLIALKKIAQAPAQMGVYEVGFQLAPRLNAAGRLENAEEALHLLMAPDLATAEPIAQSLDLRNRERQKIERAMSEEVIGAIKAKFNPETDFVIVEGQLMWHIGVVGIVASRVLQQFYRPTIILGGESGEWRGSGRSISGFDLAGALRECEDLLVRHGGHAMAAGLTMQSEKMDALRLRLNEMVRRVMKPEELKPSLRLDGEVKLADITLERIEELDRLKPMGQGNPTVQLVARNVTQARPLLRMGAEKQHVKLWLTDGAVVHEAVWWGAGKEASLPVGKFDIAFVPQVNDYNGRRAVQLKLLDWRTV